MFSIFTINNADAAVAKLLKSLNLQVNTKEIIADLDKHPDYPSMLAISDVLNSFDVANSAFRVAAEDLLNVPAPFIIHANTGGGEFLVVQKVKGNDFYTSGDKYDNKRVSLDDLKKTFGGVVLVPEPEENISPAFSAKTFLANIKYPLLLTGALLVILSMVIFNTAYLSNVSWASAVFTLVKTAGLITSVLLLVQSINSNNPLVQILCGGGGNKDCNAILSSKAANVFDGLTWSEVGFFYFAGTWLMLLFGGASVQTLQVLIVLNVLSLPYTVYSIYHQWRVAKQWCVLCCTVQAALWLEFFSLAFALYNQPVIAPPVAFWSIAFISLLSPVILWLLLKPVLLKGQQLQPLKDQLRKFKYNSELFSRMLTDQPKFTTPDDEWSLVLGNAAAENVITMVSNPYCPPCSKTHLLLDELIEKNSNVQARIIFTADNTETDRKTPVARHLMALHDLPDKSIVKKAMHDWYEQKQKDYESWAKIYPVKLIEENFKKLDKQKSWCEVAEVSFTPTLLVNGYKLPNIYQLPDLRYMLE
ncbi:MAG: vitamin K epoxide reductase family protein [Bacteroidota bacterium]